MHLCLPAVALSTELCCESEKGEDPGNIYDEDPVTRPNQTLERTVTRRAFIFLMIKTDSVEAKLGDGGGRSACSR